jgi:competence protein ComEA
MLLLLLALVGVKNYFQNKKSQVDLEIKQIQVLSDALEAEKNETKFNIDPKKQNGRFEARRFMFDPNTLSEKESADLGLKPFVYKMISKYKEKGGKYKFKEDFKRMYGITEDQYFSLEPYILLPSKNEITRDYEEEKALRSIEYEAKKVDKPVFKKTIKTYTSFDINTADTSVLIELPGIGSAYAAKVLKFRNAIGGFHDVNQIRETYGLSTEAADIIIKYAKIEKKHQKIQINAVSSLKHPFIKFPLNQRIIAYRKQHGSFKNADDMKAIVGMTDEQLQKMLPYLDFN